ncbi:MAG: hypothetical protein ABIP51_22670 [Bacteroidia bacterium]
MKKNAIVSFSNKNGRYAQNMARLSESLRNNFDGDFIGFTNEASIGSPPHHLMPYAFKIYAIEAALKTGLYKNILWLDSSCFAIKNVQPIFDEIDKDGFIFIDAGHYLGNYSTDACLAYYGITRDEAMLIKMVGNAGFLGLDFTNDKAVEFFDLWKRSMEKGMFFGSWNNDDFSCSFDTRCKGSRHDMQNSSALVYKMKLTHLMKPGDTWLQYAGIFDETSGPSIIIKAQG